MAAKLLAGLVAILILYALAGFIGGATPVNRGWRQPDKGVTIYIETNGFHTGLLLPAHESGVDWRGLIKASDLADPRYAGTYLWIGWGERAFYLETQRWSDVRPLTLLHAAFGSERTLMHVDHERAPQPGPDVRPLRLSPDQYRRLAAIVRARFATRADGSAIALKGYGPADAFYEAKGSYDAVHTCNEWVGATLRAVGVRVGWWTPFSQTVMWWF